MTRPPLDRLVGLCASRALVEATAAAVQLADANHERGSRHRGAPTKSARRSSIETLAGGAPAGHLVTPVTPMSPESPPDLAGRDPGHDSRT